VNWLTIEPHSFQNGPGSVPALTIRGLPAIVGLTAEYRNVALPLYCRAFILEFAVNNMVDRILDAYQLKRSLDPRQIADSRQKISAYLESLASAGQRDSRQLTIYGLAYLTELNEGRDPRFTGC
jgi:hypothetical protein